MALGDGLQLVWLLFVCLSSALIQPQQHFIVAAGCGWMHTAVSNCATTINFFSYYFRVAFFYLYVGIGIILLLRTTSFSKRPIFSVQKFTTNSHLRPVLMTFFFIFLAESAMEEKKKDSMWLQPPYDFFYLCQKYGIAGPSNTHLPQKLSNIQAKLQWPPPRPISLLPDIIPYHKRYQSKAKITIVMVGYLVFLWRRFSLTRFLQQQGKFQARELCAHATIHHSNE